ncbi:MAG: hypothetical protein R3D28_21935 [Geminicoccaceae bacterium]
MVDFNPAEGDQIDVSAYGYTSLNELEPNMRVLSTSPITVTILGDSAGDSLTFVDPSNNIFTAASFIYAPAAPASSPRPRAAKPRPRSSWSANTPPTTTPSASSRS